MYGNRCTTIQYFTYLCLPFQELLFFYILYILFMLAAMQWLWILQNQLFVFRMSYIIPVSIFIGFGWIVCEIWKWAVGKKITALITWQKCFVWILYFLIFLMRLYMCTEFRLIPTDSFLDMEMSFKFQFVNVSMLAAVRWSKEAVNSVQ